MSTSTKRRLAVMIAIAMVGIGVGSADHLTSMGQTVAVCHVTGSGDPVYLEVDANSFEHGHHRHHDADYFVEPGTDCTGATTSSDHAGNTTGADHSADDADDAQNANTTQTTAADDTGNATAEASEGTGNGTEQADSTEDEEPATEPVDVAVTQWAHQDDERVTLTITIGNVGGSAASEVGLQDALPDVDRPWYLDAPDAANCVLTGNDLDCYLGDLAAGETASLQVWAYTDHVPCGRPLTNTAEADSLDDADTRNNAASASIEARPC